LIASSTACLFSLAIFSGIQSLGDPNFNPLKFSRGFGFGYPERTESNKARSATVTPNGPGVSQSLMQGRIP